ARVAGGLALLWLSSSAAPVPAMEFTAGTERGASVLLAHGEIVAGDTARLKAALRRGPLSGATLYLDSPGGSLAESFRLGALIRERRLAAVVPRGAECASACVFVLAGGVVREVEAGGKVGVHMATIIYDDEYVGALERILLSESRISVDDRVRLIILLNERQTGTAMAAIANYLARMGVSMRIL